MMLRTSQLLVQLLQRCPQLQELDAGPVAVFLREVGHVGVEFEVHGVAGDHREHHREQNHDEREHEHPQMKVLQMDSRVTLESCDLSHLKCKLRWRHNA